MAFYGYTAEKPDFGFVALAGQQAGQTVEKYSQAKQIEIDDKDFRKAYDEIVKREVERWKEATGIDDDVEATRFVTKYMPPKSNSESAPQAAQRMLSAESSMEAALMQLKEDRYHKEVKKGAPVSYERKEVSGKVETGEPQVSGAGGVGKLSGFGDLRTVQERTLAEPRAPGVTEGPMQGPRERYELAQGLGVSGRETVETDIQRAMDVEAGQGYQRGQTRAPYLAGMASQGVTGGAAKDIAAALPTEKDIMAEDRLSKAQEERNKVAKLRLYFQNEELDEKQRDEILSLQAKAKADKVDAELRIANLKMQAKRLATEFGETNNEKYNATLKELREHIEASQLFDATITDYSDILSGKTSVKLPGGGTTKPPPRKKGKYTIVSVEEK